MHTRGIGAQYETMAADYLTTKGYTIVERNVVTRFGEIDIVAEKDGTLIFCEVKFRSSGAHGSPLEAVNMGKQRRISRAALWFCMERRKTTEISCRFDVIGIDGNGGIMHVENAFDFLG